ncbi:MAG: type II secretion system F family protein [Steroidobacter sp.]
MDRLTETLDVRTLIVGCVLLTVAFVVLIVRRGVSSYRQTFVASIESSLRQNFIIANPQILFVISALLTLILSLVAYRLIGPVGLVAALVVGVAGPRLTVVYIAQRRVKQFVYQLPDALLALASALRAGSNLTKGLELLATRQPPPLSQEFTIALAEYRVGRQLADSLADMRQRINTPELELMNTAMNVSRRVGGNLADTLEALAKTLQEKAHIEGKIDALTSMGRAQGWVVGLLPIFIGFVLYQQQPDRMGLMFTEWYGWVVLTVIAVMMAIATWMIRKIVNIDV